MKRSLARCLVAASVAAVAYTPISHATNGYFMIGYGAKSRSMGGAGVAYAQDGLAAAANPAGMADVKVDTMRIDVGGELFKPPRSVRHDSSALESGFSPESDGAVNHKSGSDLFLIPSLGGIYRFNRKITIGMAGIGAGLGTRYNQEVPGKPACLNGDNSDGTGSTFFNFNCNADAPSVGVTLYQMQMLPSIAYKVSKNHTLGASLALGVQMFRAYGLGAFEDLGFAPSRNNVSGEGNDFSYGAGIRLGWLGKFFNKRLSLGTNYASRVYMTKFDKYKNLFAERGSLDIPEHFAAGMAFKIMDNLTIAADIQRIMYGDVRSIANTGPSAADPGDLNTNGSCRGVADGDDPDNCKLGGKDGMGFGWQNQFVYKVGFDYRFNNKWNFRTGYNYGKSPIPDDQVLFNFLAPATVENHVTLGTSYRPSKNVEWSFNFMHAFKNTIKGPTAFGPDGSVVQGQNASITMKQTSIGVSFGYKM